MGTTNNSMITVAEARQLIHDHIVAIAAVPMPLHQAAGLTLGENIFAPHQFPPFYQSAMDGYAFAYDTWKNQPLTMSGIVQAGSDSNIVCAEGQAVRIFTGAPLPSGTDTVVMQEKVRVDQDCINIIDDNVMKGSNVRIPGSEIEKDALALPMGTYLSPGSIGFVAGLGLASVAAIPMPNVALIITGKELQHPGNQLQFGQVYESNSYALKAALKQHGVMQVHSQVVDDELGALQQAITTALQSADLVLLTGGVSVGDFDFVVQALAQCGVQTIFHKVKQRPGKPLLFGKKNEKVIFGLPGNPSSVLTCFYEYVLPAIQYLAKRKDAYIQIYQVPLAADYTKQTNLTHFLKGWFENGEVLPLDAQESYKMKSFAMANCLLVLPEEKTFFEKGEMVEIHQFI